MKSPEELFDRYLDNELTPGELVELEAWIDKDPRNAQQFVQWSATHLDTRTAMQGKALHDAVVQSVDAESSRYGPESAVELRHGYKILYQHLATAACVALVMSAGYFLIPSWWSEDSQPKLMPQISSLASDAKITQRIDCVLEQDRWNVQSSVYQSGQSIQLAKGVAVIEFSSGASVTLEAPAELEVLSGNSGFLHEGKLTAVVPESAVGFEILTPDSRVIDHGTEFAVRVSAGVSETHVFKGEVELLATRRNTGSDTPTKSTRLTATEAVRFDGDENSIGTPMKALPQRFIRMPPESGEVQSDLAIITPLPRQNDLVMWFEAGHGVQLDPRSRVVSWQNLASSNNEYPSAAWQVAASHRPLYEESHTASRPAIRFDGVEKHFLATTPIQTSNEMTVFIVCDFDGARKTDFGKLLMLTGRAKLSIQQEQGSIPVAQVFWWEKRKTHSTRAPSSITPEAPIVLACRYSLAENTLQLFANGELVAEDQANCPIATEASHLIGCNYHRTKSFFTGTIAEIAVYKEFLDRESFDQASSALVEKYSVRPRVEQP
ncbi:FecR domain-containing protein [Aporhodopirellula aestuarii]|uniref:FecR family protein n=1 Tax=Aporhodopirellula aestuarii TaxID=2950107 RepID=A0ABT0U8G6_9BACT|nr:FecR family protein [Aporhodopirellula aestuarii]MCM2372641.1 FecR family protein [Aporhodopirellula aestuarii]